MHGQWIILICLFPYVMILTSVPMPMSWIFWPSSSPHRTGDNNFLCDVYEEIKTERKNKVKILNQLTSMEMAGCVIWTASSTRKQFLATPPSKRKTTKKTRNQWINKLVKPLIGTEVFSSFYIMNIEYLEILIHHQAYNCWRSASYPVLRRESFLMGWRTSTFLFVIILTPLFPPRMLPFYTALAWFTSITTHFSGKWFLKTIFFIACTMTSVVFCWSWLLLSIWKRGG